MSRKRLVIVGNGMAGLRLLQELRAQDAPPMSITVVGAEPREAYNRILLSSYLAGDTTLGDLTLVDRAWYEAESIDLRLGVEATGIDRRGRLLHLSTGEYLAYDKLVLATGSDPVRLKMPGRDLDGVMTFRDLGDADGLQAKAADTDRAVVIGGGLLGLEAAHGLAQRGVKVTVIHLMDRLMERQLDAAAARFLFDHLIRRGIDILLNTETKRIVGKQRVTAVEFADRSRMAADLVVMAVGVVPNVALARAAGLAVERGVVVDDGMCTSDSDIYAVGECAQHARTVYGIVAPIYEQAAVCARNLCGGKATIYTGSVVSTSLKVTGANVFSAGEFLGGDGTEAITLSDPSLPSYRKLVVRRGADDVQRLAGAVMYGDVGDGPWYLDLIRAGTPVNAMRGDMIFGRDFVEEAA